MPICCACDPFRESSWAGTQVRIWPTWHLYTYRRGPCKTAVWSKLLRIRKLLKSNGTRATMVNAIIYHLEAKGVDLDGIGVVRHQYAGSSAQHACGAQRGESGTNPTPSDGGRIECAGNAGSAIVSVGCGLVDLGTANHGVYIICRRSADTTIAMKDNGLTRIRRLCNIVRCRYEIGAGTGDNPHGVSNKSGMPTETSPSGWRHGSVFSNAGYRIGMFRGRRKGNYTCPESCTASRVISARAIDAASRRDVMLLGSVWARSVDGQAVAGHEPRCSGWRRMPTHLDVDGLKMHADGHAWYNWSPAAYVLARFKHHNIQSLRKYNGISSSEQKHWKVCRAVLDPRMATRNIWRMR